jgi:alpha-L-rhamnosidase
VIKNDYHLNTGFLSTPFLLHVLLDCGYGDIAFRLLEQDTIPSWLYAITKGATTIWENWRGITPDGQITASLNHYSYGAVCDFLFSRVAGICPIFDAPGYKHFLIKPTPGGSLSYAGAKFDSPYDLIESELRLESDCKTKYEFTIPANSKATVLLPGRPEDLDKVAQVFGGVRYFDGRIIFEAGSGHYEVLI